MSSGSSNTDPTSGILRTPDGFQTASGRLRQQQSQSSNSSTNQRSGSSPIAFDNCRSQGSLPDNVRRSQSSTVQLQQPLFVLKGPHISPEEAVLLKTQAIRVPDIGSFTPRTNAGQLRQQRSQSRVISLVGTNLLKIIFLSHNALNCYLSGDVSQGIYSTKALLHEEFIVDMRLRIERHAFDKSNRQSFYCIAKGFVRRCDVTPYSSQLEALRAEPF